MPRELGEASAPARRRRAGAASGRRARGRPSPRPSAPRAAARTGRGGPAPRAWWRVPSRSTVCCACEIVAVGLNATRTTTSSPLLIPPWTPPERLAAVRGRPSGPGTNGSLCSMPVMRVPAKPLPISKPFDGGQRHQRARQVGLELVEHRLAEPGRHAARDALDHAAERVAARARGVDASPPSRRPRPRSGQRTAFASTARQRHAGRIDLRLDVVHALHPREHLDAGRRREQLARDRAGGDAPDRLARARAPAALPVADAVLRLGGEVGVRRPVDVLHVLVGARARVLVAHQQRDRRAERHGPRTRPRGSRRGPPPRAAW